jgi:hypothetical protein
LDFHILYIHTDFSLSSQLELRRKEILFLSFTEMSRN